MFGVLFAEPTKIYVSIVGWNYRAVYVGGENEFKAGV